MANEISKKAMQRSEEAETLAYALKKLTDGLQVDRFEHVDVQVVNEGTKVVLPDGMSKKEGIKWLERRIKEDETEVGINEEVDTFPLDGAYALMQVLKQIYGWATAVPTPGFWGDRPPTLMTLEIGYQQTTQVIWGGFIIPNVEGQLQTGATRKDGRWIFCISGTVKQKYRQDVMRIAEEVRRYVREHSIYRGKAIRLRTDDDGDLDTSLPPIFLDTTKTDVSQLVHTEVTDRQIKTHLYTPLEKTAECRKNGIPLKRSVLLEGPFGTGKTLTAYVCAKKAEDNGWTFIYLDRVSALKNALIFAKQYGPAVVFAEDIDRVMQSGRSVKGDDILNTIDGVDSKNDETLVILTTNVVDSIEKAMIRPGRLDAIIHIGPPDAKAAEKLMHVYGKGLIQPNADLTEAGRLLEGQIPATIAEVVKRAKLDAVAFNEGNAELILTGENLAYQAKGIMNHIDLLNGGGKVEKSKEEQIGYALGSMVAEKLKDVLTTDTSIAKNIDAMHKRFCQR